MSPFQPPALGHPKGDGLPPLTPGHPDTFSVLTAGGLFHVRWQQDAKVSANGGMVHFAQFLEATQVFNTWVADCPLKYESNRAHRTRDVLGTWLLSTLNGHWRFAHITALRGDQVNPQLLGMRRVVSEDSLRRALQRMDPEASRFWLQRHLLNTLEPVMALPWILDIDVTVKPLFGFQEGAVVGYNPHKPGRPSHTLHTFLFARARLVLDVQVHAGDQHTSATTRSDLFGWLEKIPRNLWPKLLRGDCGFGTEDMMAWPEANGLRYLFKQRMTVNTKALVRELDLTDGWEDVGQGWSAKESQLRLSTWTSTRRVVVLRRPRPARPRYQRRKDVEIAEQLMLECVHAIVVSGTFEYQVLVTNSPDKIQDIVALYRDRADAENVFDELKNQWGWGGFTSRKLAACQIAARMTAQIYNWWSIFVRLASPDQHHEAITSRPLMLNSIVRQTTSGGQRLLTIASNHAKAGQIAAYFTRLASFLRKFSDNAEQWTNPQRWAMMLRQVYAAAFAAGTPLSG